MVFVDTGAWFAAVVPWDANHRAATEWLQKNSDPLFTTDYVVDETLTLLRMRKEPVRATDLAQHFFSGKLCRLHFLSEQEIRDTLDVFQRYSDKNWSFTDCSSKAIMEKVGISVAFSFDKHFVQFGTVTVVP